MHVFFKPSTRNWRPITRRPAVKEFTYYVTQYGNAPSTTLKIVEVRTIPCLRMAPENCHVARALDHGKDQLPVARQYDRASVVGHPVSPAAKDDWVDNDGFARYSEARYVESAGASGASKRWSRICRGRARYDTVPLSTTASWIIFFAGVSAVVTDKGAMILHMLPLAGRRTKYLKLMRDFSTKYAGKSASTDDFRALARTSTDRN